MGITLTVYLFLVGASALGLWIVTRFPSFGPQSITSSLIVVIGSFGVLQVTDGLTSTVTRADGPAVALILVVLPTLTLAFWSCARLVRAFVSVLAPHGR